MAQAAHPACRTARVQEEKDVRLNPELETTDGKQNAFRPLASRAPNLFEASGKRPFLLVGLELRQQERLADADLLAAYIGGIEIIM